MREALSSYMCGAVVCGEGEKHQEEGGAVDFQDDDGRGVCGILFDFLWVAKVHEKGDSLSSSLF